VARLVTAGLVLLPALLASAPRATASPVRSPALPRPRVVLFGDSMLAETGDIVARSLRVMKPGWDVEVRAFPGTGMCSWFDEMRATDAQAVALLFSGVLFTECVGRRRWPEAYRTDGRVPVRDMAGGHVCPVADLTGPCPVYASGARRYGVAVARAVADALPRVSV
jgi:hypothetical protein